NAVLLRSFGYADIGRLAEISGVNQQGQSGGLSAPDFRAIEQRAHSFQSVGASRFQQFTLIGSLEPENLFGQLVSEKCFSTLGSPPLLGRGFSGTDFRAGAQAVTMFSYKLWQRAFRGDPGIIGRHVSLNGADYLVIGVMPSEFQFPHPAFQLWAPLQLT